MPDTSYPSSSGTRDAYLSLPIGSGPWPGVVVIHDALGVSDDIREQAGRLAAGGYLALVPRLFGDGGIRCVVATMRASRSGEGPAYEEIEAARRWLAGRDDCSGRTGIVGFCMGGGFALLSAAQFDFDAAAVNYGEVPDDAKRLAGACPVVASYGGRDRSLPGRAERLERALSELGVAHDVKEYPDAGHSFMNRFNLGPLAAPLVRFVGFDYVHGAAEDSWRRIFTFFDEHLRDGAGGP